MSVILMNDPTLSLTASIVPKDHRVCIEVSQGKPAFLLEATLWHVMVHWSVSDQQDRDHSAVIAIVHSCGTGLQVVLDLTIWTFSDKIENQCLLGSCCTSTHPHEYRD